MELKFKVSQPSVQSRAEAKAGLMAGSDDAAPLTARKLHKQIPSLNDPSNIIE